MAKQKRYSDYLDKKGPEGARGGACVARKSNTSGTALIDMASGGQLAASYAALLETPPSTAANGFNLLIAEGSYDGINPGLGGYSSYIGPMCTDFEGFPGEPCTGCLAYGPKEAIQVNASAGKKVLRILKLPFAKRPDCVKAKTRNYLNRWVKNTLWTDKIDIALAVSAYPACGQPMLIASNSRAELKDYIKKYEGAWTTAMDEGFAWGYRALHPNWRDVWHSDQGRTISPDVPADFNAGVKKKFILFSDGFSNQRFFAHGQGDKENVKRFCEYLSGAAASSPRQMGDIEIAIALTGSQFQTTVGYLRDHCASLPIDRHYRYTPNVSEIADFLVGLAEPEYETRFVRQP